MLVLVQHRVLRRLLQLVYTTVYGRLRWGTSSVTALTGHKAICYDCPLWTSYAGGDRSARFPKAAMLEVQMHNEMLSL